MPALGIALLLFMVAAVVGAIEGATGRPPRFSVAASAIASFFVGLLGVEVLLSGADVALAAGSVLTFVPLDVRYDDVAGLFLLILAVVGVGASVAAIDGVHHAPFNAPTGAAYPLFLASMLLVFGSANGFAFLLAWELMALTSAALVIGARPLRDQVDAGYLYLAVTHLATAALIVAFAVLAAGADGSLTFSDWAAGATALPPLGRDAVFLLLVVGFGTKAGAIPFHVWLPRAHPVAPAHVSALMSGVMIKAGIYGLVRVLLGVLGPGPEGWGLTLVAIGGVSAVLGILYALMERDLKRLLAFSSIENIGITLLGLGAAMVLAGHGLAAAAAVALAASLFHALNHGAFKALLFLGAGAVQAAAGSRNLNRLGGLVRGMPVTALLFGVGAAAISGLPPLNGFASEWLTFHGLIGAGAAADVSPLGRSIALLGVGALALTAALALACFVKATGMAFLALPRSAEAAAAREAAVSERVGMGVLAVACIGLGLAAGPIAQRLGDVAAFAVARAGLGPLPANAVGGAWTTLPSQVVTLPGGQAGSGSVAPTALAVVGLLVGVAAFGLMRRARRAPTWTCGVLPESAMEYTATSYSKLIRLFFRRVLLPEREVHVEYHAGTPLPSAMHYTGSVTHVLEQHVFGPLHAWVVRGSSLIRRLQNGSLQVYLAYALIGLVILLAVTR